MDNNKKSEEELAAENARLEAEVEQLKAHDAKARHERWLKVRKILTPILVVLTCISIVETTIGVWTNRTIWNTNKYIQTVTPLAKDPAIINAMATKLTDEAFVALNVPQRVQDALATLASSNSSIPEQVTFLAAPITDSLHKVVREQVVKFLSSDTFQQFWLKANEALHPKIVALLQGDYSQLPHITVTTAGVQINLLPMVTEVLRSLAQGGLGALNINLTIPTISSTDVQSAIQALSTALGVSLPPDFGQITIMSAAQLRAYQQAAHALQALEWGSLALAFLLLILTIAVAPRRRRVVVWLGAGTIVAIFLGAALLRNLGHTILNSIHSQEAQAAARAVFMQLGGSLKHTGRILGLVALIVAIVAYLLGRPPWLQALIAWIRRITASQPGGSDLEQWVGKRSQPLQIGVVVFAVAVLFFGGISLMSIIVVGVLLGLALWGIAAAHHRIAAA